MVYHGVVSKGCQRCRQRKIRCDQRKPGCARCEKTGKPCPGYRNLNEVLFRDESERTVQKARQAELQWEFLGAPETKPAADHVGFAEPSFGSPLSSRPLSQPIPHLGASFFFAKYSLREPPISEDYNDWLAQTYLRDASNHVLRGAIEAVGMAGISNISNAPEVASRSRKQYCDALNAVRCALDDPVEAIRDETFTAIILLTMFEAVTLQTRDDYRHWRAHVQGSTALLELRGPEQFNRQRGGILYVQVRSQILTACMQQKIPVPPALEKIASSFRASGIRQQWQSREIATSGSISGISFRIVNLRAAFKNGSESDPMVIRDEALDIEAQLAVWTATLPPSWSYDIVDTGEDNGEWFGGKRHIYLNLWTADVWNNWRAMRIVINQIIIENEGRASSPDLALRDAAIAHIRRFSTELCMTAPNFIDTPRAITLIRPLYLVGLEQVNTREVRAFAGEQLKRIDTSMGIRQAGVMAATIARKLGQTSECRGNEDAHASISLTLLC